MSAAAAAALPRSPSSNRRQSSYNPTSESDRDRPHRSHSTAHRSSAAPSTPQRSMSTAQTPPPAYYNQQQPASNLDRVARLDFEKSNVGDLSRDPSERSATAAQSHVSRATSSGHARTTSRYTDQPTPAPAMDSRSHSNAQNLRRRTTIDAQTGHWELGKTVGAGSMGKVKLARNKDTGEQVAVKIVPRQSTDGEHRTPQERERADHSKEVRTAREAAIVTLVDHPYICGMRDVVRTNYHWYMLFEYVNGGQMLDYIISHGRLKEKQARKFGRQIASALDYCHRNSIVHRDLKIENILISKTGDIKIIDFGLSNLFSPRSLLKTFCGSLYFAAPELLQAKEYTGPEVDVWSFGIVLYVLVCGKVPFDDQSMPQLHAKIKKGVVEYPPWLTPECRGLIARMLTTNPSERATLHEIMNHPWLNKGFNGPPENYLPVRKPLQFPLDPDVIEKMTGFDFGDAETIQNQLSKIVESEDYQRAIRLQEKRAHLQSTDPEIKRGGVLNFYKRRSSAHSRDTLNAPSSEALQLGLDPVNAFHPLISVYYLAMEKQEREAREKNPGALALPQSPGEKPLPIADLPAPEAAHTNTQAYEMAGENPTGGRSRARARTHGQEDADDVLQSLNTSHSRSPAHPTIVEPQPEHRPMGHSRKESAATSLLRRFSTRRGKDLSDRSERPTHPPPALAAYGSQEGGRKSLSIRRRDASQTREPQTTSAEGSTGGQSGLLNAPLGDATNERVRRTYGLGRSVSVSSSDTRRRLMGRGVSEGSSMRPPMTASGSMERKLSFDRGSSIKDPASDVETSRPHSSIASRTRSTGHSRMESTQIRRPKRESMRTSDVPEETEKEMLDEMDGGGYGSSSPTGGMKPVYLKGLFSVSTTSSKPLNFIRADIIRVLRELGVEYREIRGGFSCKHQPSIMTGPTADETAPSGAQPIHPNPDEGAHRRKISFNAFRDRATSDRDDFRHQHGLSTPRSRASAAPTQAPVYSNSEEDSDDDRPLNMASPPTSHPRPGGQTPRAAGETSTHVQSDLGGQMTLKFEIFVVKVPLLSLHGIQFKKVDGGTWQYKNMAQKILYELRL